MQVETRQFASVSDLLGHARSSVAAGLVQRVRRDDQAVQPRQRTDWLPAIGAALVALADDPGDGPAAVADFFATASVGAALVDWLNLLIERGFDARTSVRPAVAPAQGPVGVDTLALALNKHSEWLRDPQVIWFDLAPSSAAPAATEADLVAAVQVSVSLGRPRTSGAFDPAVLGWLRHAAIFSTRIRAVLPALIAGLLHGTDARGCVVGLEYAVRAGDRRWCIDALSDLASAAPTWLGTSIPDARALWPKEAGVQLNLDARSPPGPEPAACLGDLLEDALSAAAHELATAPRMDA